MNREVLIEKYILGTLTSEERAQVEEWMKTDPSFKEELEFQSNLKPVIEKEEDASFKTSLKEFEHGHGTKRKRPMLRWLIAASFMILVVAGSLLYTQSGSNSLFAENFQPYANVIQPVVRGDNTDDIKGKAFLAYENEEFELAETHFTTLLNSTSDSYVLFYLANTKLALNKANEAIPLLNSYMSVGDNLSSQAQWYLALAHLQTNETAQAKNILQKIVKFEGYGAEEAVLLLKKLK